MEGLADDLSIQQNEFNYMLQLYTSIGTFSASDMGTTGLIKHRIDTDNHRPVRLPPRGLPSTEQEIKWEEV